jgi:DNA-binding IclR family transcriptional regulator
MNAPAERDPKGYENEGQQRLIGLIQVLAGHELHGLAPAAIAKALGCSASAVTRDTANLQLAGWAEQVPETGNWRLGPAVVQVALKHMAAMDRAASRLEEIRNRFSRTG